VCARLTALETGSPLHTKPLQICELLLSEGVKAYKKEGSKFMQRPYRRQ